MNKLLFFDLETTGINHWQHGIHQISGIIEIDGVAVEYFDYKVRPVAGVLIEPKALDVCSVKHETILSYEIAQNVHLHFTNMLAKYVNKYDSKDKFHLVGYNNAAFDNQFLRAWFTACGDNYFGSWFWSDTHDTLVLASKYLCAQRSNLMNFQLSTVARFFGVNISDKRLHDAVYDVELTREIYHLLEQPAAKGL